MASLFTAVGSFRIRVLQPNRIESVPTVAYRPSTKSRDTFVPRGFEAQNATTHFRGRNQLDACVVPGPGWAGVDRIALF